MSLRPDLTLDTEALDVWTSVQEVLRLAERLQYATQRSLS